MCWGIWVVAVRGGVGKGIFVCNFAALDIGTGGGSAARGTAGVLFSYAILQLWI